MRASGAVDETGTLVVVMRCSDPGRGAGPAGSGSVALHAVAIGGRLATGEGEEDIVEGGPAQRQVRDRDLRVVQRPHRVDERRGPRGGRDGEVAPVAVDLRRLGTERGEGGDDPVHVARVFHPDFEHVAPELRLELVRRTPGDDPTVVDDHDGAGQRAGLLQVLGREEDRRAVPHQLLHEVPQLHAGADQDPSSARQDQDPWLPDEAGTEVEAAAHASRVGAHGAVRSVGEAQPLQGLLGPLLRHPGAEPVQPPDHLQVLPAGEHLVDGGVLAGEPDDRAHGGRLLHDVEPGHPGPPRVRLDQRGQDLHQRCLAGPVRTEEPEHAGRRDVEVDAVERPGLPERLGHTPHLDHRAAHGHPPAVS